MPHLVVRPNSTWISVFINRKGFQPCSYGLREVKLITTCVHSKHIIREHLKKKNAILQVKTRYLNFSPV